MAINFPNSPTHGQTYDHAGITYTYVGQSPTAVPYNPGYWAIMTYGTAGTIGVISKVYDPLSVIRVEAVKADVGVRAGAVITGILTQTGTEVAIGAGAGVNSQGSNAISIGSSAGSSSQGADSVSIGLAAGQGTQGINSVAIGNSAANSAQGASSVAVGVSAGMTSQGSSSVAVGNSAGSANQSDYAIAIGSGAGSSGQGTKSIAIGKDTIAAASSIAIGDARIAGANQMVIGGNGKNLLVGDYGTDPYLDVIGDLRINGKSASTRVLDVVEVTGTTYTVTAADLGKMLKTTNASPVTITLPEDNTENLLAGFQIVVQMGGTGEVSFVTEGADVLNAAGSFYDIQLQFSAASIVKESSGTWWKSS